MSYKTLSERQEDVNRKLGEAFDELVNLETEQKQLDEELKSLLTDRNRYALLSEISDQLDQLQKIGGAHLFWGESYDRETATKHHQRVRHSVITYDERVRELQSRHHSGEERVQGVAARVNVLNEESTTLEQVVEDVKHEFIITREATRLPYRAMVMPWTAGTEDDRRLQRIMGSALLLCLLLIFLIPLWEIPVPDRLQPVEVPERLAKMILEKQVPPPPPIQQPVEKLAEQKPKDEKRPEKEIPKPTTEKAQVARKKAENAGLMAFKDDFSQLMNTSSALDQKLGSQARINTSGKTAKTASRSLVTAQTASGSSGGINTAALSRDVGGAGQGIKGVGFERIETAIGSDFFGEERPLSSGPGPSRTDEEIQIVFDRYKSALYRIYNRELRSNPTLQGKMVLRLTIQPNGIVSACKLDSSDMKSPKLEAEIVDRVLGFNFGPKEGVPPVTILYPIDFLPAT